MTRLLILLCLALIVAALAGLAVSSLARAAKDSHSLMQGVAVETRRNNLQKIGYVALILVMLGVTSGLLGGL